jgi:hypothetical protein
MLRIENEFDLFQMVYLKTDPDQSQYQVISIRYEPGGVLMYLLRYVEDSNWHYPEEISSEPDMVKKTK